MSGEGQPEQVIAFSSCLIAGNSVSDPRDDDPARSDAGAEEQ